MPFKDRVNRAAPIGVSKQVNQIAQSVTLFQQGLNAELSNENSVANIMANLPKQPVYLQRVFPASVVGSLMSVTKNGALSSATNTNNAGYDKFAVSGGTTSSTLVFNNAYVCDTQAVFKATVKVENLNADGSSNSAIFGIGITGVQGSQDTGSNYGGLAAIDLINKTAQNYAFGPNAFTILTAPSGVLVANGDILDIEYRKDQVLGGAFIYVINKNTGATLVGIVTGLDAIYSGLHNGVLTLMMTNASYTLLDVHVLASTGKNPLLHVVGDSLGISYHVSVKQTLNGLFPLNPPYQLISSSGNGAMWDAIDRFQMQDVLKVQAKNVLIISGLPINYDAANSGGGNYAAFKTHWDNVMRAITSYGGTPIVTKFPVVNPIGTQAATVNFNNFIDAQVAFYPTLKVLDLTNSGITIGDQYGHLTAADWAIVTPMVINLLKTLGY